MIYFCLVVHIVALSPLEIIFYHSFTQQGFIHRRWGRCSWYKWKAHSGGSLGGPPSGGAAQWEEGCGAMCMALTAERQCLLQAHRGRRGASPRTSDRGSWAVECVLLTWARISLWSWPYVCLTPNNRSSSYRETYRCEWKVHLHRWFQCSCRMMHAEGWGLSGCSWWTLAKGCPSPLGPL